MLGIMFNIWSVVSDHQISVLATLQYKCFENSNVQPGLERMIFSPGVFGLIISEEDPNLEVAYAICFMQLVSILVYFWFKGLYAFDVPK